MSKTQPPRHINGFCTSAGATTAAPAQAEATDKRTNHQPTRDTITTPTSTEKEPTTTLSIWGIFRHQATFNGGFHRRERMIFRRSCKRPSNNLSQT
eukprot:5492451-Amphidinium_carterae.1